MSTPMPKGFSASCEDIAVDIYEYDAYIAGLVQTYLDGHESPFFTRLNDGVEIDMKLSACEERLHALKGRRAMQKELTELLRKSLLQNQK